LDNDRVFAACALVLIASVATLLSTQVLLGPGTFPSPLAFAEHVALGLSMRAAYKWIGGWNPADWSVVGERTVEAIAVPELLAPQEDLAKAA
jgi:hypothetical protein